MCIIPNYFRFLTGKLPFVSPFRFRRYYRSKVSFPIDVPDQNDVSTDGIAILSDLMKPRAADRMSVSAALLHSWTCVREPALKRAVPAGHDFSSQIIEEIPIADLQLKADASNVGNDGDKRRQLNSGTAVMPQTTEYRSLNTLDAAVRSTGVKTTENKLNRLKRELGLNERIFETQMRELREEHPTTLRSMANLAINHHRVGQHGDGAQLAGQTIEV